MEFYFLAASLDVSPMARISVSCRNHPEYLESRRHCMLQAMIQKCKDVLSSPSRLSILHHNLLKAFKIQ